LKLNLIFRKNLAHQKGFFFLVSSL